MAYMRRRLTRAKTIAVVALVIVAMLWSNISSAEPVAVRHPQGLLHGFLSLKSAEGKLLASGDLIQDMRGELVTTRVIFHFKDGSLHDEKVVFSQNCSFKLINYKLVQKGPSFDQPLEMTIDGPRNHVIVRYKDDDGEAKIDDVRMNLPPDLANGLLITFLTNIHHNNLPSSLSFVAATPKPRLVKLVPSYAGTDRFSVAGSARNAAHYIVKVDIGGLAGAVAPLVGKQPLDSHVWILEGAAPVFLRAQTQLFTGGPLWQMDRVAPVWPRGK
jgi:hypothetical protein